MKIFASSLLVALACVSLTALSAEAKPKWKNQFNGDSCQGGFGSQFQGNGWQNGNWQGNNWQNNGWRNNGWQNNNWQNGNWDRGNGWQNARFNQSRWPGQQGSGWQNAMNNWSPNLFNGNRRGINAFGNIDDIQQRLDRRIQSGITNGRLTQQEADRLQAMQTRINDMESRYRSDNNLTWRERNQLNDRLNSLSYQLQRQLRDNQVR